MNRQSTEDFQRSETILYDTIMVDKPIECTTPKGNPKVNYGLWVGMMCQCEFMHYNECITLVQDVDSGASCACVGLGGIWELSVLSTQFFCELKTTPKIKSFKSTYARKKVSLPNRGYFLKFLGFIPNLLNHFCRNRTQESVFLITIPSY